jgi:hypothetical protein
MDMEQMGWFFYLPRGMNDDANTGMAAMKGSLLSENSRFLEKCP